MLVFNQIPTQSGASADLVIGQIGGDGEPGVGRGGLAAHADVAGVGRHEPLRERRLQPARHGVFAGRGQHSRTRACATRRAVNIVASGTITIGGEIQAKDVVTITINGTNYQYTVVTDDTLAKRGAELVGVINGCNSERGRPERARDRGPAATAVVLTAREPGSNGNSVTYSATVSPHGEDHRDGRAGRT